MNSSHAPLSRGLRLACALAIVGGVAVLHHEVLLGGHVYHMDDAADGYYPSHVAIARAYAHGELATWERGSWCGWPLGVDPYYGAYYPLSAISWIAGAVRGLGWQIALHSALACAGMLLLLRRRRLAAGPALLGALAFGLSSFLVVRIRHIIFAQAMAWLPWVLAGAEGWLATRRRRELVLAAAATGMMLVCGALPLVPFLALAVAAYVTPRLATQPRAGGALAAAATVGLLLGMAQIVPTISHVPLSPRGALPPDYQFASSYAWPDARYLGTLIAPELFGGEQRGSWFGAFNHWEMAGYYAGALVVLLAPLGVALRRRGELYALAVVALVGVALAFGDGTPLHGFLFRHAPLYATLRCPTRALVMFLVAVPILAAEGLDALLARAPSRRTQAAGAGVMLLVGLGAAAGVTLWLLLHPPLRVSPGELATRRALAHLTVVVAFGAAAGAAWWSGLVAPRTATLALALITLIDLVTVGRASVQPQPRDWATGTERFAAVDWLIAEKPTDRFIPDAHGPFRLHNLGMTYGLESAGGYDSVSVWRYVNLLHVINFGAPYPGPTLKHDLAAGDVQRFGPLVDLLNVRWAIATAPPQADWVERFRPAPGGPPHARHEPVWDPQLRVYENPHVLPRAFVVYRTETLADDAQAARRLATLDPRRVALVDAAPVPPPVGDDRPLTPARVTIAARQRVVIEADATAPGLLVLSETHYPGWSATVDGRPAPLLRADYALRGVALPAGHHVVEMRFSHRPTWVGLALAALGLIGLGLLGLARRRPRPVLD